MSCRVTGSCFCRFCGEQFEPRRSDAAYCSNADRQAAYRRRKRVTDNGTARLTADVREYLRREIDRRRRVLVTGEAA